MGVVGREEGVGRPLSSRWAGSSTQMVSRLARSSEQMVSRVILTGAEANLHTKKDFKGKSELNTIYYRKICTRLEVIIMRT